MRSSTNLKLLWDIFWIFFVAVLLSCEPPPINVDEYSPDPVIQWNKKIMDMAVDKDGLLTLNGVRTEALAHLAVHNALNAIHPVYNSYQYSGSAPGADPLVATAQAFYEVTKASFPDNEPELSAMLKNALDAVEDGEAKEMGIGLGKKTAGNILAHRNDDNWDGEASYTWHPMAPGVYAEFNEHSGTPEGFVFGAGWAKAKPFMLESQDQFRSPPPPEINSDAYTVAYNEVKMVGSTESEVRTADQTHMAMWWKDFVESSHNRLARELIRSEDLNLWKAARTLALMNMAIYDAYVSVFENKFYYNHWRPYTAIRWAANDGNPDTEPDEDWNNLHRHTYAFPSYPSAHGTASSAAMTVLTDGLGTGNNYEFTMTTVKVDSAGPFSGKIDMDPPTRSFDSFSEAGLEASLSRLYLGIHFRYDSEEGHRLGNTIGEYANENFLTELDAD